MVPDRNATETRAHCQPVVQSHPIRSFVRPTLNKDGELTNP